MSENSYVCTTADFRVPWWHPLKEAKVTVMSRKYIAVWWIQACPICSTILMRSFYERRNLMALSYHLWGCRLYASIHSVVASEMKKLSENSSGINLGDIVEIVEFVSLWKKGKLKGPIPLLKLKKSSNIFQQGMIFIDLGTKCKSKVSLLRMIFMVPV